MTKNANGLVDYLLESPVEEAVLGVDASKLREIMQVLRDVAEESRGNPTEFARAANELLKGSKIRFENHPTLIKAGAPAMVSPEGVCVVRIPSSANLYSDQWFKQLEIMLDHELVHISQMSRMKNPEKVHQDMTAGVLKKDGSIDQEKYWSQKQEVMAWASTTVKAMRDKGMSKNQILTALQFGDERAAGGMNILGKYKQLKRKDPATYQKFIKYATQYANNMDVAESEGTPFDALPFPTTQDQVNRFRRRRKVQAGRTVL